MPIDILLDLPDDVIEAYRLVAKYKGTTVEDEIREVINSHAGRLHDKSTASPADVDSKYQIENDPTTR